MEMRDPSSAEHNQSPEEQTLNQAAPALETDAATENAFESFAGNDPEQAVEDMASSAVEAQEQTVEAAHEALSKESLIEAAKADLEKDPDMVQREHITRMRQQFNAIRKVEIENARTLWAEEGNDPAAFVLVEDPLETEFNNIIASIRDRKNARAAEIEEQRRKNLEEKTSIIAQINALAEDTDNVNRTFPLYRELQEKFNAIGEVPPSDETAVWKHFQEAREHYSDNLKINKELRDYDFKKNLDSKNILIAEAEGLAAEEDVITAFRRLQELHDKWRQIGPVAKELRDEIWQKFKDASAVVNKRYQAFFEERKARETENENAKTALCEQIEALDFSALASFNAWDQMTGQIIALQNQWKTIGFASRKVNNALFARFRQRCDEFFSAKAAYFRTVKDQYAANLAQKTALAERAEALKDSTEWRKATDEFVAMQKQWKTIGPVPKKHSDAVWKRFQAACDYFFEQKKQVGAGARSAEQANLQAKKAVIEQLQQITPDTPDDQAAERMQALREQWQAIGHVPFREKDRINEAYRTALNEIRHRLGMNERRDRMERFEANITQLEGDQQKLLRERDRLARALENRRNEIRTYENNIGFLTSKSKSGQSMLDDFRRKIDHLKEDIGQIQDKIRLIDSKL